MAESWVAKIDARGYQAEVVEITANNRTYYRVRFPVAGNREAAEQTARRAAEDLDLPGVWVSRA